LLVHGNQIISEGAIFIMIKVSSDLLKLTPYPSEDYETYALANLTACSVFLLQEWKLLTNIENVIVLNHRLFPTKFSLVGWPQFPDANRTNRSILQMRPKYRNLAASITDEGVFLNERGRDEATAILSKLGPPKIGDKDSIVVDYKVKSEQKSARPRTVTQDDVIVKIKKSRLFKVYAESRWSEARAIDLLSLLGVYDHTPVKEKRNRLEVFKTSARETKDIEVQNFIKAVEDTFSSYLSH